MTVYIGIDWSQAKHDVCLLDEAGEVIACVILPHLLLNSGTRPERSDRAPAEAGKAFQLSNRQAAGTRFLTLEERAKSEVFYRRMFSETTT